MQEAHHTKQEKGTVVIRVLHTHMYPRIGNFPVPKLK